MDSGTSDWPWNGSKRTSNSSGVIQVASPSRVIQRVGTPFFHQLAYDLRQPNEKSIIRQVCIWSNSPAVHPKHPIETQDQFNELLTALKIPLSMPEDDIISHLRSLSAKELLDAAKTIQLHQFRPTTDGDFVSSSLFQSLDSGEFAQKILSRNIHIMIGECADERFLYSTWFPPQVNTLSALRTRLTADYPQHIVDALIAHYYPSEQLPGHCRDWNDDAWGTYTRICKCIGCSGDWLTLLSTIWVT